MKKFNYRAIIGLTGVFAGMFNGKTTWLVNHQKKYFPKNSIMYRPSLDTRELKTHDGMKYKCKSVNHISDIGEAFNPKIKAVYFDEVQFFDKIPDVDLIEQIKHLTSIGKQVFVAGLDYDFRLQPFVLSEQLKNLCNDVLELKTYCIKCGKLSKTYSFRKTSVNDVIVIGGEEEYEPRCEECFFKD